MTLSSDDKADLAAIFETTAAEAVEARGKAPLRAGPGRARLLRTESGRVVTHGEVVQGLFKKLEIEVQVIDGKRPAYARCSFVGCGEVFKVGRLGPPARFCAGHGGGDPRKKRRVDCPGQCGRTILAVTARHGGCCRSCAAVKRDATAKARIVSKEKKATRRDALIGATVNGWKIKGWAQRPASGQWIAVASCKTCGAEYSALVGRIRTWRCPHRARQANSALRF